MEQLITFQTFASIEEVTEVAEKLQNEGIATEVVKATPQFSAVIIGTNYTDSYILKIAASDFSKANKLLYNDTPIDINLIDADHPLRTMNNDELRDVIAKPDEWGADNYRVAVSLLNSRGITVSANVLDKLKSERASVLAKKKSLNPVFIAVGYIMACFPLILYILDSAGINVLVFLNVVCEFLWFLGIMVGFVLIGSKTTLPDGTRSATFNDNTKLHGKIILGLYALSILTLIIWGSSRVS